MGYDERPMVHEATADVGAPGPLADNISRSISRNVSKIKMVQALHTCTPPGPRGNGRVERRPQNQLRLCAGVL